MKITYREGDFLAGDEIVVIHGCNAQGVMGRGAALAVSQRYPVASECYRRAHKSRGLRLGEVIWVIDMTPVDLGAKRPRIIGNAITQEFYGPGDRQYVNYDAVRVALGEVRRFVGQTQDGTINIVGLGWITAVALPAIGSGLGGGDWDTIATIIEEESRDRFQPIVYRLPPR